MYKMAENSSFIPKPWLAWNDYENSLTVLTIVSRRELFPVYNLYNSIVSRRCPECFSLFLLRLTELPLFVRWIVLLNWPELNWKSKQRSRQYIKASSAIPTRQTACLVHVRKYFTQKSLPLNEKGLRLKNNIRRRREGKGGCFAIHISNVASWDVNELKRAGLYKVGHTFWLHVVCIVLPLQKTTRACQSQQF